jgi:hypothetical protein
VRQRGLNSLTLWIHHCLLRSNENFRFQR